LRVGGDIAGIPRIIVIYYELHISNHLLLSVIIILSFSLALGITTAGAFETALLVDQQVTAVRALS